MHRVSSTALLLLPLLACGGSVAHQPTAKPPAKAPAQPALEAAPPAPPPPATEAEVQPPPVEPLPQKAAGAESDGAAVPLVVEGKSKGGVGRREVIAPAAASAEPAVPVAQVQGGDIPRSTVLGVLSRGIGRFLQKVPVEAHVVQGRFRGWRLLSQLGSEQTALQPGDTVLRVNGQSIERPEQFKNVWDSMATQSELVLLVERAGKQSEVRYRIVE